MHRTLALVAALFLAAIFVSTGLALMSSKDESPAKQAVQSQSLVSDDGTPDPAAKGVILLAGEDYSRAFTPAGEDLGMPNAAFPNAAGLSVDGKWQAMITCFGTVPVCPTSLVIAPASAQSTVAQSVTLPNPIQTADWSPTASVIATMDASSNLYLFDAASRARLLERGAVSTYDWSGRGDLVFVTPSGAGSTVWAADVTGKSGQPGRPAVAGDAFVRFARR